MAVTAPPAPVRARQEARPPATDRWTRLRYRVDTKGAPYLYIAPFFLIFFAFGMFPLVYTGWMAMTQWNRDVLGSNHTFDSIDALVGR